MVGQCILSCPRHTPLSILVTLWKIFVSTFQLNNFSLRSKFAEILSKKSQNNGDWLFDLVEKKEKDNVVFLAPVSKYHDRNQKFWIEK